MFTRWGRTSTRLSDSASVESASGLPNRITGSLSRVGSFLMRTISAESEIISAAATRVDCSTSHASSSVVAVMTV